MVCLPMQLPGSPGPHALQRGEARVGSGNPLIPGASGSGRNHLISKQNVSPLLKVKRCAEFLSLSKARIEAYEKEVRMRLGLSL